jgi:hypothetical protein
MEGTSILLVPTEFSKEESWLLESLLLLFVFSFSSVTALSLLLIPSSLGGMCRRL